MPRPARTGGGSKLPMRDLITMAKDAIHYLAVFDGHSGRPLYLGRSTRIATADQRIICYGNEGIDNALVGAVVYQHGGTQTRRDRGRQNRPAIQA
jgi:hypothetical protein